MKKLILAAPIIAALSACADQPDTITAASIPAHTYAGMSCKQLIAENNRIVADVQNLSAAQKQKADNDAAVTAVAMIIFWPALFALSNSDHAPQLAVAKGQYNAVQSVITQRGC